MRVPAALTMFVTVVLGVAAGAIVPTTKPEAAWEPPPLPTLDDMGAVYGLPEQYACADREALLAELGAFSQAYNEEILPIVQRELSDGRCEIVDAGLPRRAPHFMELEGIEHDPTGRQRRVVLSPSEYPGLLEYRVRVVWLAREAQRRGYGIPTEDLALSEAR